MVILFIAYIKLMNHLVCLKETQYLSFGMTLM